MRVKICGITEVDDLLAAVAAGVDAIGLNFVGGPRRISLATAQPLLEHLPAFVTPVALVRVEQDRFADDLAEFLDQFRVSHLQLYGNPTIKALDSLLADGFKPIPVVAVKDASFHVAIDAWPHDIRRCLNAVVLDAYDSTQAGGTGKTFTWSWVAQARQRNLLVDWPPIVLAGGLNPANVAEAVEVVQPYAVDVSSGVERAGQSGKKDPDLMRAFVRAAKEGLAP